jgi:hypothetical protein
VVPHGRSDVRLRGSVREDLAASEDAQTFSSAIGGEPRHVLVANLLERRTGKELALTGHTVRRDAAGVENDRRCDIDVDLLDQDLQVRRDGASSA